jgi:hypothetical protein
MLMISLISIFFLSKALSTGERRWWIGFAVGLAINIHNHVFTVFLAAALAVFIIALALRDRYSYSGWHKFQVKNIGIACSLTLVLILPIPILIWTSNNTTDSLSILLATNNWPTSFPPLSLKQPTDVLAPFIQMSYTFSPTRYPGWQTYGFIGLFLIGTIVGFKRPTFRWSTILLVLIIFLSPFLMTLATTLLGPWFYALRRYFLFVMPPYLILASLGMLWLADFLAKVLSIGFKSSPLNVSYLTILPLLLLPVIFPILRVVEGTVVDQDSSPHAIGRYLHTHADENDIILCVPDTDWRISSGREHCSLNLNLFRSLAPNTYYLDRIANYETLQNFLKPEMTCRNEYVHLPHPDFTIDCTSGPMPNHAPHIWLILWRSRDVTTEAALAAPLHPLLKRRFEATDIIYVENRSGLAATLIEAGEIALQESKTPLRKFENYVSLATIYLATGHNDRAFNTLDEAAFVSRWPEAIEQLAILQAQLSFIPVPDEPEVSANVIWNDQIALIGTDQNLKSIEPTPGNTIQISFHWQLLRPATANYRFWLHLVDAQGTTVASFDYEPFDGQRPLTDWIPHNTVRETRTFNLPPNLSPGTYALVIGIYSPDTLERLPITGRAEGSAWVLAEWELQ